MRTPTRRSLTLVIAAATLATAAYTTSHADASKEQATAVALAPAVKVALAPVQRSSVPQTFSGIGELEAIRQVQVAAEVAGRVTRIAFESGQAVKSGQVLVQINDAPEQAERIRLQAQLRNAETVYERSRKLVAQNAATQEQLEQALAARDMVLGTLRQTDALIAQKTIRAPFAGMVGIRRVHEGQYLNVADPVANLIDARNLYANFALDEQTTPDLKIGQMVDVLIDAYPDRRFQATINAIDPLIAKSRTVQVQARLANPDAALKAGMYARIQVARQDTAPVLTVPETAVTYTAYGETVFLAQRSEPRGLTVKRVAVKAGARRAGRVEIEHGLAEGDQVVTSGQIKLGDGMRVEAVKVDTLTEPARSSPASPT